MLDALVKVDSMFGLEGISVDGVSSGEFLLELNNLEANPTPSNLDTARAAMLDFITTLQKQTSRMEAKFNLLNKYIQARALALETRQEYEAKSIFWLDRAAEYAMQTYGLTPSNTNSSVYNYAYNRARLDEFDTASENEATAPFVLDKEELAEITKVQDNTDKMRDINNAIEKPAQAKKLFDKLIAKTDIDSELREEFADLYADRSIDTADRTSMLQDVLTRAIDNYEQLELARVTGGKYIAADTGSMEQAMYIAEASTDFDAFLTFAKENLRDFEARELLDKIPKLENWWSKTTDALKARGIKRPKPLEQYELLELPSDIPLVRNEVECK